MAEACSSNGTTSESDILAMKETLRAQQQLLQKLYAELDEEREASATATSEALDMILRLQGEKAAVKMEASQYARMAEEKIEHAETTLEIFEELMFQKDMEIASLEFQVQAYRRKLVSLGCDPNLSEFEFPENELSQRNDELQKAENGQNQNGSVRRLSSLPPFPVNKNNMRAPRKRERSPSPLPPGMMSRVIVEKTDNEVVSQSIDLAKKPVESTHETLDSFWEQIKKLDEKVKVISDCKEKGDKCPNLRNRRYRSCSLYPRARSKTPSMTNPDQVHHGEVEQNREAITDPSSSVNVHDVFEVPQHHENHRASESEKHRLERLRSDAENRLTKPDPEVSEEKVESQFRYDSSKLMKILSTNLETQVHGPRDDNNNNNNNNNDNKITCMFGPKKEGMGVECNGQAEFHVLSKRIERLEKERERVSTRQEITHERDEEEQLRLLKEILSRLKLLQEEMRSSKAKKSPPKDDLPLVPLHEAMLYFWL